MEEQDRRPNPPVFSTEEAQNHAQCAAIWYTYAKENEKFGDEFGARMGFVNAWREQPEEIRYYEGVTDFFRRKGLLHELLKTYEIGIQMFPKDENSFAEYANLLTTYGYFEKARDVAETWLSKVPDSVTGWGNLGNALSHLGDFEKAKACYLKVLKEDPRHAIAGTNYAHLLLAERQYREGWLYYNYRLNLPGYEDLKSRNTSEIWTGQEIEGKRLLVYAEQGIGDTLMFLRYLFRLLEMGADVVLEVQSCLAWWMKLWFTERVEIIQRETLKKPLSVETDFQIPLLSLPGILFPEHPPSHLECDEVPPLPKSERAIELLSGLAGYRVGLCWQGNPHAAIDLGRSMSLNHFQPLMSLAGVDWVSLQARDGLEMVETFAREHESFHYLTGLDASTPAFEETLAIMEELDLVITTDTSIAHLAGLLKKPCWVLLQKYPEWRWGHGTSTSDWYPHFRLFRQNESGDWTSVIQEVSDALQSDLPFIEQ